MAASSCPNALLYGEQGQSSLVDRLGGQPTSKRPRNNIESVVSRKIQRVDNPIGSRSSAIQDKMQGIVTFKGAHGDEDVLAGDSLDYQVRYIARLGPGPYPPSHLLSPGFVNQLQNLTSAGASRAARARYIELVRSTGVDSPVENDGPTMLQHMVRVEQIPNLFLDSLSLASRSPALRAYAEQLDPLLLSSVEGLERVKADLDAKISTFFPSRETNITIVYKPVLQDTGIRPRVREAFNLLHPISKGAICKVAVEGSNLREWVVTCGSATGMSRKKKEAAMIARVKCFLSMDFDPNADGDLNLEPDTGPKTLNSELLVGRRSEDFSFLYRRSQDFSYLQK